MILEVGIYQFLRTRPAINAIVSGRIFHMVASQQAALPRLVMQRLVIEPPVRTQCYTSKLQRAHVQIDSYSQKIEDSYILARAVRNEIIDFDGFMGAVRVQNVQLSNESPLVDPDPGIMRVSQTWLFWYLED